jgi:phosphoglycerol transferase MdoB-like AlkP superfamily enzyme
MFKSIRIEEYKVLAYRLFLAYLFYFFARVLFFLYNSDLLKVDSIGQFFNLCYHGLVFDTTAILYVNLLFIALSALPFWINTSQKYQKFLFWVYIIFNAIAYAFNFLDLIYYRFTHTRSTIALLDFIKNESNNASLFSRFIFSYWHVFLIYFLMIFLWIYLYKKVSIKDVNKPTQHFKYFIFSIIGFLIIATLVIGGIRSDFNKSTRPINLIDANRYVTKSEHADIVLNTPFAIIRTMNSNSFKKVNLVSDAEINTYLQPIKQYKNNPQTKPNIVLIITESLGREYLGSFNKDYDIPNFKSYTPFIDSLAQHSYIFTNAYSNGSKSIHGMSSIIAGIPSFRDAFTSSPYPKQKIESLVSTLESVGYKTSFFHGAANGSMGFLGFGNILGFDNYFGRTEFNNDAEFDGSWGIWDEPFLQFMREKLNQEKAPFFSTIFTVSSHEPYIIPEKYKGKFPKGGVDMYECVGYTDFAFKQFFKAAQKEPWYKNTLFIITADHGNQHDYPFYNQTVSRRAVPILFYKPDGSLKGKSADLSQQIDIYPSILDLIGYQKPFRSWGRSLFGDNKIAPFVFNFNGNQYQFIQGNYTCIFDGTAITGVFDAKDYDLKKNIMNTIPKADFNKLDKGAKAFYQDYMERIIDQKLYAK